MLATAPFKKSQKHIRQLDGPMAINGLPPLETSSAFPEAKGTRIKIELMPPDSKGLAWHRLLSRTSWLLETADRLADDVDADGDPLLLPLRHDVPHGLVEARAPTTWQARSPSWFASVQIPILYRATAAATPAFPP